MGASVRGALPKLKKINIFLPMKGRMLPICPMRLITSDDFLAKYSLLVIDI